MEPDLDLAYSLFEELRGFSFDGVGITRDTFGAGEERAHALIEKVARQLGLQVRKDAALNLYVTLPGRDRSLPAVMTGSHLDSVPRGGNYDGAAGVVAGLAVLAGWLRANASPARDVTVMGVRAEESAWFPVSYVGSRAAFGLLPPEALDVRRSDTQRTLRDHMQACGGRPDALLSGEIALKADSIDCFVELHIEQGPVLVDGGETLGIVTGICGSRRYRNAKVIGQYAHSGATPRSHRHDAVVALATLLARLQAEWEALEKEGRELTLTFGQVNTDAVQADFSKVPGLVAFCIDMRSRDPQTLGEMDALIQKIAAEIESFHGVRFDLGPVSGSQPAQMNDQLQQALARAAQSINAPCRSMASGAGHDSATFANQGVATAMLFVRNTNGSHNPDEAMAWDDFDAGVRTLARVLAERAGLQ